VNYYNTWPLPPYFTLSQWSKNVFILSIISLSQIGTHQGWSPVISNVLSSSSCISDHEITHSTSTILWHMIIIVDLLLMIIILTFPLRFTRWVSSIKRLLIIISHWYTLRTNHITIRIMSLSWQTNLLRILLLVIMLCL